MSARLENQSFNLPRDTNLVAMISSATSNILMSVCLICGLRPREDYMKLGNNIKEYFNKPEGSASWQDEYIRRTFKL